jgi:predicted nucleic acid-binding protein
MMNSLVCTDASLALKLVLNEPDSALARALWEDWKAVQATVIAPTLWGYEVTSVIRNRVHRGQLPLDIEGEVFAAVQQLPVQLMEPTGLHQRAWELARHFNRPAAYDAHYLALAEMAGCPFWTADERLFNVVRDELDWVHWLGDYGATVPLAGGTDEP